MRDVPGIICRLVPILKRLRLLVRQYLTGMLGYYSDGSQSLWNEMGRGVDMQWTVIA